MTLDDLSGLPVLPEGQFWRVRESLCGLEVAIMQKTTTISRGVWGPKSFDSSTEIGAAYVNGLDAEAVLEAAQKCVESQVMEAKVRSLIGDYPPKRLEVK